MRIDLNGFFSKWGFQDGDMDDLEKFTYDNPEFMHDENVTTRSVFNLIVKRDLLPNIENKIKYHHMENTCHNEHRIEEIDGIKVDFYDTTKKYKIHPEYIEIKESKILEYCRELEVKNGS